MNAVLRWIHRNPTLRDYLEGASMVLPIEPAAPSRPLYQDTDALALVSDMHAVGRDLRKAMDEYDNARR
jgi:hypothetical protein